MPLVLTAFFGIVLLDIANSASLTATETTGPWFNSQRSLQMYTATLTASIFAALILVLLAASCLIHLNSRMRAEWLPDWDFAAAAAEAPVKVANPVVVPQQQSNDPRDRFPPQKSLRRAQWLVLQSVAGPLIMFLIIIAISARMLLGIDTFAQAYFQLNTGLILFLTNTPFLIAWTLAAIAVLFLNTRVKIGDPG